MARKEIEKEKVLQIIEDYKKKKKIKLYTPYKYFKGITSKKSIILRMEEMLKNRHEKDPAKIKFTTDDKKKEIKKSKYHVAFEKFYKISSHVSLKKKEEVTGVPLSILQKVRARGIAAWKTGHRLNTNPNQWGNARVSSFLTLGCTAFSSDADLIHQVNKIKNKKIKLFFSQKPSCPKSQIDKYKSRSNFPSFLFK